MQTVISAHAHRRPAPRRIAIARAFTGSLTQSRLGLLLWAAGCVLVWYITRAHAPWEIAAQIAAFLFGIWYVVPGNCLPDDRYAPHRDGP